MSSDIDLENLTLVDAKDVPKRHARDGKKWGRDLFAKIPVKQAAVFKGTDRAMKMRIRNSLYHFQARGKYTTYWTRTAANGDFIIAHGEDET